MKITIGHEIFNGLKDIVLYKYDETPESFPSEINYKEFLKNYEIDDTELFGCETSGTMDFLNDYILHNLETEYNVKLNECDELSYIYDDIDDECLDFIYGLREIYYNYKKQYLRTQIMNSPSLELIDEYENLCTAKGKALEVNVAEIDSFWDNFCGYRPEGLLTIREKYWENKND